MHFKENEWPIMLAETFIIGIILLLCGFSLLTALLGTFAINLCLVLGWHYSVAKKSPIVFQFVLLVLLGGGLYGVRYTVRFYEVDYVSWLINVLAHHKEKIVPLEMITSILICTPIFLILYKDDILEEIKNKIDYWIPPMWLFVIGAFVVVEHNIFNDIRIKTISALIFVGCTLIVAFSKNKDVLKKNILKKVHVASYIKLFTGMCMILTGISLITPMPEQLPGIEWLRQITNNFGTGFIGNSKEIGYQNKLHRNPFPSEKQVFVVEADTPLYLRTAAYTYYNNGSWYLENKINKATQFDENVLKDEYGQVNEMINMSEVIKKEFEASSEEKLSESEKVLLELPEGYTEQTKQAYIIQKQKGDANYMTLNGFTKIKVSDEDGIAYFGAFNNLCLQNLKDVKEQSYTIEYTDREIKEDSLLGQFEKNVTLDKWEEYVNYLQKKSRTIETTEYNKKILEDIKNMSPLQKYNQLKEAYTQVPDNIRDDFKGLADKIVRDKNAKGDYAKAQAIQDYLRKSGEYSYNLRARTSFFAKDYVYDFVFVQKEGICQDFASAMTLLCRTQGLPTRYVVGYYATEYNPIENNYIVREKDAHAFVEVYIPGFGWTTFDPTPVDIMTGDDDGGLFDMGGGTGGNGNYTLDYSKISYLMIAMVAVLIMVYIFGRLVIEWIWVYKTLKLPGDKSVQKIFEKLLFKLKKKGIGKREYETSMQYVERLQKIGIDIKRLNELFTLSYYGQKNISNKMVQEAYSEYKKIVSKHIPKKDVKRFK